MAATTKEIYGSMVFNEHVMKERLPSATFKSLKATIDEGKPLDLEVFCRFGHIAVTFDERFLAIHHPGAGRFAQFLDHLSCNVSHSYP